MSKKCSKCGCVMEDSAKFCDECGTALEEISSTTENSVDIEKETQGINMYSDGEYTQPDLNLINEYDQGLAEEEMKPTVSSGNKALGIISLICGILSILSLGSWIMAEIIAIVCGLLSKDSRGRKTKLGKAGFICGIIGVVFLVLIFIVAL